MAYKVVQAQGTALTDLYTVPSDKNAVISTIAMCNYGTASSLGDVFVRPGGATKADIHTIASGVALLPGDTVFITAGLALGTADVVSVQADSANVTFHAYLNESDA
jgi:hypothetical protein